MNTALGYKVEKINVSTIFKGYQFIHKVLEDPVEKGILWVAVSRVSNDVRANAILKYNTTTKSVERTLDFSGSTVYSIHASADYIGFLSSPQAAPTKRYLSFLSRVGGNASTLKSLAFTSTVSASEEYGIAEEPSLMHFDGRYYWTLPKSPALPIKKIDILESGSSLGMEGMSAPGGSAFQAIVANITNWCPSPSVSVLDGKAYPYKGSLYFFPRGGDMFKLNLTTGIATAIVNAGYLADSDRVAYGLTQLQEAGEFSEAGDTVLIALRETTSLDSPVNTLGVIDLVAEEYSSFSFADYPALQGNLARIYNRIGNQVYFPIPAGETQGIFFDTFEGETYRYHILSSDATVSAATKTPGPMLDTTTMLFFEVNGSFLYRFNRNVPCRVIVHHILENGTLYAPEEIFYGAIGDSYALLAKTPEGKEVASVVGQQTGTFTVEDIVVDFYYANSKVKTFLKVQMESTTGDILQTYTLEGFIGDPYAIADSAISGYVLETRPGNASGTLVADNAPVVFVYRKLTAEEIYSGSSYLSISYVDETGQNIQPSLYAVFPLGSTYNIPAETIPGYTRISPATLSGTCYENTQHIRFEYARKTGIGLARINYMAGTTTMKTVYVEGTIGATQTYTAEEIPGFNVDVATLEIVLAENTSSYDIPCTPVVGLLLVSHTDRYDGSDIFPKEYEFVPGLTPVTYTIRGRILDNYKIVEQATDKAIYSPTDDGWSLYKNGTFHNFVEGKIAQINLVYDTLTSTVKVRHEKGEQLLEEETLTGTNGQPYNTEPKDYEEYQIQEVLGQASGLFGSRETVVTYRYEDRQCKATVEHLDAVSGGVIERTEYTQNYGTSFAVPFKTFAGHLYLGSSIAEEPDTYSLTMTRDPQTIRFYHTPLDPALMLKPTVSVDEQERALRLDLHGYTSVLHGVQYKVEKRLNGGPWQKALPRSAEFAGKQTVIAVLNLIEDDGTVISYTPFGGTLTAIPGKGILKSWLESENNGISVTVLDAREFEKDPHRYLVNEEGEFKYSILVDGTYSLRESCTFTKPAQIEIVEWINSGRNYVDCSKGYKMSGRTPAVATEKELMIQIVKAMHGTTAKSVFAVDVLESPATNYIVELDEVRYDKIYNQLLITASSRKEGAVHADAVYDFQVSLINCNDGTVHATTQNPALATMNTSLPMDRYRFLVDESPTSIPQTEPRGATYTWARGESLNVIDRYIHVLAEDVFGRQTPVLHTRHYQEILPEDLTTINGAIHYMPRIVRENHRYRGPMESKKFNNTRTQVANALKELQEIFEIQGDKLKSIKAISNLDTYRLYIETQDRSEV